MLLLNMLDANVCVCVFLAIVSETRTHHEFTVIMMDPLFSWSDVFADFIIESVLTSLATFSFKQTCIYSIDKV